MVRELSDTYAVVVYVYHNTGIKTIHINFGCESDNFGATNVICSFEIPKVKSIKTGLSFVGGMRLVTGLSEGNEKL